MSTKHAACSSATSQKVVLVVLLALVLLALVVMINVPWTNVPSQIAASWGNGVCESHSNGHCQAATQIAASWGNKSPTSDP